MKPETLKRKWLEQDEGQITAAIEALLQHAHGRKFLWWLLEIGGIGGQPFSGNALTTSFNCGQLNVGNQVQARILEVSPEGFITMMKEQANERSERSAAIDGASAGSDRDADPEPYYGGSAAD